MRWICFFLLFANIGYGLWNAVYVHAKPHTDASLIATSVIAPAGGVPLILIEELSSDTTTGKEMTSTANQPASSTVDEHTAGSNPLNGRTVNAHSAGNSGIETLVPSESGKRLPSVQAKLSQTPSKASVVATAETTQLLRNDPALCWAAGPIFQPSDADHLAKRAAALADQVKTKTLNTKTGEEFWVYLKPLNSHKAALTKLRELHAQRIDSFVVTRGQYQHAISLGLFSKMESAQQHVARMKTKGLDPKIEVRDRTRREFWVQFHLEQPLETAIKQRLRGELESLKWQPVRCDTELAADL